MIIVEPDLHAIFASSLKMVETYVFYGIAIGIFAGVVYCLRDWLLSLPLKLIKWVGYYIAECFGHLTSCTTREIKQTKRKISKTVDIVENVKDVADSYKSLKK